MNNVRRPLLLVLGFLLHINLATLSPSKEAPHAFQSQLIWLDGSLDKMYTANINAATGALDAAAELLDLTTLHASASPNALSIDETNGKIYWTDRGTTDGVYRSDLDGTNAELYEAVTDPRGIYVDDINGHIYYTDDTNNAIKRMDIVGSAASAKNVVSITGLTNIDQIRSVAFDKDNSKLFWTDNNGNGGSDTHLSSATLTAGSTVASSQSSLIDFGSSASNGLYYDEVNDRIFAATSGNTFQYYDISGGTTHSITSPVGGANTSGIATDATNGYIYVSRNSEDQIGVGDYPTGGNSSIVLSAADSDPGTAFPIAFTVYSGPVSSAPTTVTVAATAFLEGAYNGSSLNTTINGSIPSAQPYSGATYNSHAGTESATAPASAVDWVLVELREAGSAAAALNSTKVGSAAGFLMSDGSIKATDGTSNLTVSLSGNTGSDFYVVIYHRNHLPIMSAAAVTESSGTYTIDFTSSSANTHQTTTALASLSGSKFGMPAGDIDQDGDIDATDLSTWRTNNGISFSYGSNGAADFNLDGVINAVDRNDFHQKNTSKTRQVPST